MRTYPAPNPLSQLDEVIAFLAAETDTPVAPPRLVIYPANGSENLGVKLMDQALAIGATLVR